MLPDDTLDELHVKMVILTYACMASSATPRLEVAANIDCRAREADEHVSLVRREFLDDHTTWTEAPLGFERLYAIRTTGCGSTRL